MKRLRRRHFSLNFVRKQPENLLPITNIAILATERTQLPHGKKIFPRSSPVYRMWRHFSLDDPNTKKCARRRRVFFPAPDYVTSRFKPDRRCALMRNCNMADQIHGFTIDYGKFIIFNVCLGAGSRQYCRYTKSPLGNTQYCLLPAPKHTLKIIISYFPVATRFPYYISTANLY